MHRTSAAVRSSATVAFRDGLGERRLTSAPDGRTRETLRIRAELASVAAFEFALRERVSRLAGFEHPHFGPTCSVERQRDEPSTLTVSADAVEGVRLSELLLTSVQRGLHFDLNAALAVLRQLVPAMAALHEALPDVAHGVLGPERVIITPDGRVVIADYVLGAAVEQLRYSQRRYWKELHVALPRASGHPRIDQRADATQIGVVALSLILGRPLRDDEYPGPLGEVVGSAWAVSSRGGFEPLPPGLRGWLGRALQLDQRNSFDTAIDARAELARVLTENEPEVCAASLDAFLATYATPRSRAIGAVSPPAVPETRPNEAVGAEAPDAVVAPDAALESETTDVARVDRSPGTPPSVEGAVIPVLLESESSLELFDPEPVSADVPGADDEAGRASTLGQSPSHSGSVSRASSSPGGPGRPTVSKHPVTRLRPASRSEQLAHPDRPLVPQLPVARGEQGGDRRRHGERRSDFLREPFEHSAPPAARRGLRLVGVSLGLAAMVAGSALAGRRLGATPTPPPPTTGTVEIQTNPPGARVSIDGQSTGMTPMTLTLTAGAHALELSGDGTARSIQLSVKAGGHTSQFVELPPPAPAPTGGRLDVRTDPSGVAVSIDGAAYGTTPTTIADLPPGDHVVVLSGPEGQVRRVVSIDADATTMLDVPLKEGASLPDRGWLVVSAPIDVTVRRDGRDLGQAGSDRIALEPGRHDLEFVNDALHYRAGRTVQIAAGRVRTIQLDVPTGSLAINALPWADAWVDGRPVGQTPLSSIGVAIGRHEVTLRHPELGERRRQIVVSPDAPTRLTVDFKQP